MPIRCAPEQVDDVRQIIPCDVATFPIKYLGLLLSIHKLTKADLQCYVDKIADMLPGWKARLLARAGRLVLVRAVLSAVPVYMMIAMEIPKWVIKAIEKILQGFLWRGGKDTRGGHCLIAWGRVARPLQLGGLGVHNLQTLNWALRMRWLWLQRTDPDKPWAAFNIQVHDCAKALFAMSVTTEVGDGSTTLFWTHRWIAGKSVEEIASSLLRHLKKKRETVQNSAASSGGGCMATRYIWYPPTYSNLGVLPLVGWSPLYTIDGEHHGCAQVDLGAFRKILLQIGVSILLHW